MAGLFPLSVNPLPYLYQSLEPLLGVILSKIGVIIESLDVRKSVFNRQLEIVERGLFVPEDCVEACNFIER